MNKHAYLIMAHKFDLTFKTLISMLDYENNDIYIHMDSKVIDYDFTLIKTLVKKSNIYEIKRFNVAWGGFSQIAVELELLKAATRGNNYSYYHLISGEDLPIKTNEYIYNFFENCNYKEFVRFQEMDFKYNKRVQVYYPFQEKIGRKYKLVTKIWGKVQQLLLIKRNKNIKFQKGDNWFSITDELAKYVVEKENWIYNTFKMSLCCDEIFLQTLIINSRFINNLYYDKFDGSWQGTMRLVDWNRGRPYVYTNDDYNEIVNSDKLFARKFDSKIDSKIIERIKNTYVE